MIKVVKFGGSSLAGADQFKKVKDIILSDPSRSFVVVSAAGKRNKADNKVTDLLYLTHAHIKYGVSYEDIFSLIEQRYLSIRDELKLNVDLEKEFYLMREELKRGMALDRLVSRGEYLTAILMADYLGYDFADADKLIKFNYDGTIDFDTTYANISEEALKHPRLVIPGFYGSLPNGVVKVMSRGGSDITGSIVANAVDADVYENWTDVSGILMADPKIVKDPKPIEKITYQELRELAYMGASVIHDEAVQPVKEKCIPLNIRNTNEPEAPGTFIMDTIEREPGEESRFITGIAGRRDFTVLTVYKKHLATDTLSMRKALEILENSKVEIEHITLGIESFTMVVPSSQVEDRIYDIVAEIKKYCLPDSVKVDDNIALIASVGRKMVLRPGISGKLLTALGENGINIRMIAQGADEISIIVGVDNQDFEKTIRVLYQDLTSGSEK